LPMNGGLAGSGDRHAHHDRPKDFGRPWHTIDLRVRDDLRWRINFDLETIDRHGAL
jgi:hypothetical protein